MLAERGQVADLATEDPLGHRLARGALERGDEAVALPELGENDGVQGALQLGVPGELHRGREPYDPGRATPVAEASSATLMKATSR